MFGIVFGTLLGVSLILISRIDQHLACRKSSLAVLCRSGSSVQRQTPLNFLVVGDWGRNGLYNQSLVAEQMGNVGAQLNVSFIISTGDNFYENGLTGPDDEQFSTSFSNIYTQKSLQTTWYSVLGNHDYHGNVSAQVDQKVTFRDPRWNCHNNFQLIHDLGNTPQGICTAYYEVIVFSLSWNWNSVFVSPLHSGSSYFHLCHFRSWIFNLYHDIL
jgi:hypothetical protein